MINTICLDENYSTTRLLTQEKPEIVKNPNDKFETVLFLPEGEDRKGEGGLRTKGYFKKSLEEKPLISIITVVYNGEQFLEETILSVINQSYDNVEYIIIDGGSTDGTVDIIKKYEDRIDYWVSERDSGISDAFNKGIRSSTGSFIELLNNGDKFLDENSLEYMVMNISSIIDIVAFQCKTDTGNIFPKYNRKTTNINVYNVVLAIENSMIAHQACLISLSSYKLIGLYSENYLLRMDFDFFIRAQKIIKIFCFNHPIIFYRTDGISSAIFNRLNFKLEELQILKNEYRLDKTFLFKYYCSIPIYLLKKFISYLYYKAK